MNGELNKTQPGEVERASETVLLEIGLEASGRELGRWEGEASAEPKGDSPSN